MRRGMTVEGMKEFVIAQVGILTVYELAFTLINCIHISGMCCVLLLFTFICQRPIMLLLLLPFNHLKIDYLMLFIVFRVLLGQLT